MAERMAINTPIQGTAADIIKVAMIKISKEFKEQNLKSKMLLQVHDELIFDCEPNELDRVQEIVKSSMEHAVHLKVPLVVDMGTGSNWYDLK
jgi:DNA polymerase-1